jgi:hypothetical protein
MDSWGIISVDKTEIKELKSFQKSLKKKRLLCARIDISFSFSRWSRRILEPSLRGVFMAGEAISSTKDILKIRKKEKEWVFLTGLRKDSQKRERAS